MAFIKIISFIGIGFALSIDAFFACIALAIDKSKNKKALLLTPFLIGFMHTLFPIIAALLVFYVFHQFNINKIDTYTRYISFLIFVILGLWSIFKKEEEKETIIVTLISVFILTFSDSIDSVLVGISYGFEFITKPNDLYYIYIAASIFGIISGIVSFLSIKLGNKLIEKVKNVNFNIISGLFFILLGFFALFDIL